MRIVLTTLGSVGDVRPFVALGIELREHGHAPVFALPAVLLPFAQRFGFEAIQLGPDLREEHEEAMRLATNRQVGQGALIRYEQALLAALPEALRDLHALSAGADLLVSANVMPLGRFVHDMTGIPFVSVQLWYPLDFPPIDEQTSQGHPINQIRAQMGLPQLADPRVSGISPQLELLALSHEILPPDWSSEQAVTGFFFLDDQSWQPDPSLEAFLAAGPPPVLITLGSTMHDDPDQLTALFIEAVGAVGCRAIIQQGWTGLGAAATLPETIYPAEYIAHDWIFPQVAAVVHHGGAGTTATALRAAVPTVVIPHSGDQFKLAERAHAIGCASAVIPFLELTAAGLRDGMARALEEPRYREAAVAVGERVRAEQGVQTARARIEQLAARGGRR